MEGMTPPALQQADKRYQQDFWHSFFDDKYLPNNWRVGLGVNAIDLNDKW